MKDILDAIVLHGITVMITLTIAGDSKNPRHLKAFMIIWLITVYCMLMGVL